MAKRKVPTFDGPLYSDDDLAIALRPASEVAKRTLILWAVVLRSEGVPHAEVRQLIDQLELWDNVSPKELSFLNERTPAPELCRKMQWRLESIWALLWALGDIEHLEWPRSMCDVPRLAKLLKPRENDRQFIAQAKLRSGAEILDAADLIMRINWAIRQSWINHEPIPEDLDGSGSAKRLPVRECAAVGVVEERHHALNWLIGFDRAPWDTVDTPT